MMRLVAFSGSSTTVRRIAAPGPVERLPTRYPHLVLVHAPIHASWLNQVEIYFSIAQRKVLNSNDFTNLEGLAQRLLDFQYYWQAAARPFEWKFTRPDLTKLLNKLVVAKTMAA